MSIFGTSGIRKIANRQLLELGLKVGLSLSSSYKKILIGSDTRTSSPALKSAVIAGLLAGGANCHDCGVLPTPSLAYGCRNFDAAVMITASHNPPQYNGIKLWNPDGSAFSSEQQQTIENLIANNTAGAAHWTEMKAPSRYSTAITEHIARIRKDFPDKLNLKVVLDCCTGAASVITPYLLRELGCQVITINGHPSGFYPHNAEPTEENLQTLMQLTRSLNADLGIAHDGDADRMMAVDNEGQFIPGDKLLIILARAVNARKVITTLDASMAIDEMDFSVIRTQIGDPYVSCELKKQGDFGGEPSGSWIFPEISFCPDGIYAAAQICAVAAENHLAELCREIPNYPIIRGSLPCAKIGLDRLKEKLLLLKPLAINESDGIKLNFSDSWALVRPSGTEPKIRITVEAKEPILTRELYDTCLTLVKKCAGEKNS